MSDFENDPLYIAAKNALASMKQMLSSGEWYCAHKRADALEEALDACKGRAGHLARTSLSTASTDDDTAFEVEPVGLVHSMHLQATESDVWSRKVLLHSPGNPGYGLNTHVMLFMKVSKDADSPVASGAPARAPQPSPAVSRAPKVTLHLPDEDPRVARVVYKEWDPEANSLELCLAIDGAVAGASSPVGTAIEVSPGTTAVFFESKAVPAGTPLFTGETS